MPRQEVIRSAKCQAKDCANIGELTLYKGQYVCRDCMVGKDEIHATDFLCQSECADLCQNYGDKIEYGDWAAVQVAVGQKSRYRKSKDGQTKRATKTFERDPIRFC